MSATTTTASLPSPETDDPSDVAVALEAARALWENGERDEALRWFSRAVEAAEQAGNDRRAVELARAVADMKDGLRAASQTPPPPATTPKPPTRPPPPSARKASLPPTPPSMRPRTPEPPPARAASVPPPLPQAPPPLPQATPPLPDRPERTVLPFEVAEGEKKSVRPPPAPPVRPEPPIERAGGAKGTPEPAKKEAVKAVSEPAKKEAVKAVSEAPKKEALKAVSEPAKKDFTDGEWLRVSVKSSVRDPDLFLVRVLRKGQAVPADCHEAFLSPSQEGVDLRNVRQ